jgi:CHASE2 domain
MTSFQSSVKWVIWSAIHALLLLTLTLIWMNLSWEFSDEVIVARINQIVRYELINSQNKTVEDFKKNLICVNGSYDKELIPFEDDGGSGNVPVTDRGKLAGFIHLLNQAPQPPRLVVVDITFDNPSKHDSLLRRELAQIKNLVISTRIDETGEIVRPWPELNFALARYATTSGKFLKYNLVDDTIHYLPTAMYKETEQAVFHEIGGLARSSSGWWLNSFMVDLPIRQIHMDQGEILVWNLGEALTLYPEKEIHELIADKIIILGDFRMYDNHETLLGTQPGPLIVANAYLGMLQGIPRIKLMDGFLIFLLYFLSSLYVFFWRSKRQNLRNISMYRWKVGKFVVKYLTYLVVFSLYSILLYLLTSRHFQLLLFGLYFNLFEFLMDKYRVSTPRHVAIKVNESLQP